MVSSLPLDVAYLFFNFFNINLFILIGLDVAYLFLQVPFLFTDVHSAVRCDFGFLMEGVSSRSFYFTIFSQVLHILLDPWIKVTIGRAK